MKISYTASETLTCPICKYEFQREELHRGRGRIVADTLTQELRYTYKPSEKFGIVNPLLYTITTCPSCTYSSFKSDFNKISKSIAQHIDRERPSRTEAIAQIFPHLNFRKERGVPEGIASYYYAIFCYECRPPSQSPTFKQGLAALRLAWLCNDMHAAYPSEQWCTMAAVFYRKARYFYRLAWQYDEDDKEKEAFPDDFNLGPDTDKNYGIDGIRYLVSYLEFQWGTKSDPRIRKRNLSDAKERLNNFFKVGVAQKKSAPEVLSNAQNLHAAINKELQL